MRSGTRSRTVEVCSGLVCSQAFGNPDAKLGQLFIPIVGVVSLGSLHKNGDHGATLIMDVKRISAMTVILHKEPPDPFKMQHAGE